MAIETFKRYETKYLLDLADWGKLQSRLLQKMEPDAYNQNGRTYLISNIYYDTPDFHLIRTSLQKPVYKEKLRLRAYGVPSPEDQVFLEIKKKYQGIVNKRRSAIVLSDACQMLASGQLPAVKPYQNRQVLREIAYLLERHPLQPKLYLAYDRLAFFDRENSALRISFDLNIRSRQTDLHLESGSYGEPLLAPGQGLLEIKAAGNLPFWLVRLLSDCQLRPVSFSKYGAWYNRQLIQAASRPLAAASVARKPCAAAVCSMKSSVQ
jgi:hypothetical protein